MFERRRCVDNDRKRGTYTVYVRWTQDVQYTKYDFHASLTWGTRGKLTWAPRGKNGDGDWGCSHGRHVDEQGDRDDQKGGGERRGGDLRQSAVT